LYKEIAKKRKNIAPDVFVTVVLCLILIALLEYIPYGMYKWAFELAAILIATAVIYILIHRSLVQYSYCFIDDQLLVNQKIGNHDRTICEIDLKDIESFKQLSGHAEANDNSIKFDGRLYTDNMGDSGVWEIIYKTQIGKRRLHFKPGKVMIDIIRKRMEVEASGGGMDDTAIFEIKKEQ
jgi:hypothetical protein